jgi:hypothetical protein
LPYAGLDNFTPNILSLMKAIHSRFFLYTLLASGLFAAPAWSQTAFDPSRASQAIRPDISAQPLLRDEPAGPRGLADENNFAITTPGDSDIGQQLILKRQERVRPFYVALDSAEYFTDNAFDTHTDARKDWFYVGGLTAGWQPRLTNRIYFDASLAQHWFRYADFSELDYEEGEALAGVIMVMPELWNTLWHLHYYYERITQGMDNKPIYQTHTIRAGVQKNIIIDRLNTINISALAAFSVAASPTELRRHEYSLFAAWNLRLFRQLFLTTSYRLGYYDYLNLEDREDWFHNFGVALAYRPKEWLELAVSWNYSLNRSNIDVFSYDAQLVGPAVSLKAKF